MHVSEIFDPVALQNHIDNGMVKATRNIDDNLTIYNYTPKAQYTWEWDDVLRNCRGLILDDEGTVVARPFPKFFNYGGEDYEEDISLDTEVTAYDKLDGSLGIVYWDKNGQIQVATRGSFSSVQAKHASEKIKELNIPNFENITILVEIIYPENQIIVDYKGKDDLFLLGGVLNASGDFLDPIDVLTEIKGVYPDGGFRYLVQNYPEVKTVQDALNNLNRYNREGFVLHTRQGTMVKVKQDDYVAMHRAVFATSRRSIWHSFAHDMLEKTGKDFKDVATSKIKQLLPQIEETGGSDKFFERLMPLLPGNLQDAARDYLEGLQTETKEKLGEIVTYLQGTDFSDVERRYIYQGALDSFGPEFAGIITDIATSESEDGQERGFDRLVLAVVDSVKPTKGERLTEELTEEEE